MKKRLYISDLDGTLLNSKKVLSKYTIDCLNQEIEQGTNFSIATARTPATVEYLLEKLEIREPIVLMNGAVLYDLQKHQYIDVEYISSKCVEKILDELGSLVEEGFIYTIQDNLLVVYYDKLQYKEREIFYTERQNTPYKKFVKQPLANHSDVAYFVFIDEKEKVATIYNKLKDIEDIALVMYRDIYSEKGYILEVYSNKATKANAIIKLKNAGNYDEVICFGDNLNDVSMFNISDEAYAVDNALDEVKKQATATIDHHNEDSVARFIRAHRIEKEKSRRLVK